MTDPLLHDDTARRLGETLDRLAPGDTNVERIEPHIAEVQADLPWPAIHVSLLERVERLDTARDRMALVLHASDPDVATSEAGKRGLDGVFEVLVAAADDIGLGVYLGRCQTLLTDHPVIRRDLPEVARLIEISDQIEAEHEATADALICLAQRIEDVIEAEVDADADDTRPDDAPDASTAPAADAPAPPASAGPAAPSQSQTA